MHEMLLRANCIKGIVADKGKVGEGLLIFCGGGLLMSVKTSESLYN